MCTVVKNKECDRSGQSGTAVLRRAQDAKNQTRAQVTLYFLFVWIHLTERAQPTNRLINNLSMLSARTGGTYKPYKDVYR